MYDASLKYDNAICQKVTSQPATLTGIRKGKVNLETSPEGLDLGQTLMSDDSKGHNSSKGRNL